MKRIRAIDKDREEMQKVVYVGGGTGLSTILLGVKKHEHRKSTGVCPGSDDGGDTGNLVHEHGLSGCIGDLRKGFEALSNNAYWAKAAAYRFKGGRRNRMVVGNDLIAGFLSACGGDWEETLRQCHAFWGLSPNHEMCPATVEPTQLCVFLRNGEVIRGEEDIVTVRKHLLKKGLDPGHEVDRLFLEPSVPVYPGAKRRILESDVCVIVPGSLLTSIKASLEPDGMAEAVRDTRHKLVLMLNLVVEHGENDHQMVGDYVHDLEKILNRHFDVILYSGFDKKVPNEVLIRYRKEKMIFCDQTLFGSDPRVIRTPLRTCTADGFLRHDPHLAGRALDKMLTVIGEFKTATPEQLNNALRSAFARSYSDPEAVSA